jgi:hypothetical protein
MWLTILETGKLKQLALALASLTVVEHGGWHQVAEVHLRKLTWQEGQESWESHARLWQSTPTGIPCSPGN